MYHIAHEPQSIFQRYCLCRAFAARNRQIFIVATIQTPNATTATGVVIIPVDNENEMCCASSAGSTLSAVAIALKARVIPITVNATPANNATTMITQETERALRQCGSVDTAFVAGDIGVTYGVSFGMYSKYQILFRSIADNT